MANKDAAFGLNPVRTINGGDWKSAEINVIAPASYAVDLFVGSPVKIAGDFAQTSTSSGQTWMSGVTLAAPNESIDFIITGFTPDFQNESLNIVYGPASTLRQIQAVPVQGTVFQIQASAATGSTSSGSNANITAESGNGPNSTVELDSSSIAATGTHSLSIIGVSGDPARGDITSDNAVLEVIINKTQLTPGSTGV